MKGLQTLKKIFDQLNIRALSVVLWMTYAGPGSVTITNISRYSPLQYGLLSCLNMDKQMGSMLPTGWYLRLLCKRIADRYEKSDRSWC